MSAETGILRLAACATHPIQYQAPLWRRLAADPGLEFEAFFGTDMSVRGYTDREFGKKIAWDTPLTEGYRHTFLSTDPEIERAGAWMPSARGLGAHFRRFRPQVVLLTAYAGRFHLGALCAARSIGAKVIMRHEASDAAVARSVIKGMIRDFLLRRLYARVDGFAVIGHEARKHLLRLGVPESKMVSSPYCVDTDFFAGEVARWAPRRAEIRREFGIAPTDVALVFSGKLIPKKDPLLIPAALRLLPPKLVARIHWLVAGEGGLRGAVEREAREVLGTRAHFLGFLNQSEIGRAYAAGDLLVLPSRRGAGETWGLVVNEAMQFGLPAVVSDGVGCGPDLVRGGPGEIFADGDPPALADVMERQLPRWPEQRERIAGVAQVRAAGFSVELAAAGLKQAAKKATESIAFKAVP